jgi:hypothetical protein
LVQESMSLPEVGKLQPVTFVYQLCFELSKKDAFPMQILFKQRLFCMEHISVAADGSI